MLSAAFVYLGHYALRGLEIYESMSFLCSLKALVDEFRVLGAKGFAIQLVMSCVKDVTWARNVSGFKVTRESRVKLIFQARRGPFHLNILYDTPCLPP